MEAVRVITGTAVPLDRSDVDTDQIIPSDWLKRIERTGFGKGLFSEWRDDRNFVLNQAQYAGANILIAGPNFGTGSSREHAVWALEDYGFKAVVSPRFGDIFRNNATKVGLLPVQLPADVAEQLLRAVEADPTLEITIDVERRTLSAPTASTTSASRCATTPTSPASNPVDQPGPPPPKSFSPGFKKQTVLREFAFQDRGYAVFVVRSGDFVGHVLDVDVGVGHGDAV
jgi:3-isopropylmalate/(R)-2-methylmalate dehydratase small subunit